MKLFSYLPSNPFPYVSPCLSLLLRNYFELNPKCNRKFIEMMKRKAMANRATGWLVLVDEHRLNKIYELDRIIEKYKTRGHSMEKSIRSDQTNIKNSISIKNNKNIRGKSNNVKKIEMISNYTRMNKPETNSSLNDRLMSVNDQTNIQNCAIEMKIDNLIKNCQLHKNINGLEKKDDFSGIIGFLTYRITTISNQEYECLGKSDIKNITKTKHINESQAPNHSNKEKRKAYHYSMNNLKKRISKEPTVIIYELHIEESFRSIGLGSILLKALTDLIFNKKQSNTNSPSNVTDKHMREEIDSIILFVDQQNVRAINFYSKNRFKRLRQYEDCEKYHCYGKRRD